MNFVVAGGTGFIGTALTAELLRNHHAVTVLSRRREFPRTEGAVRYLSTDPERAGDLERAVGEADCVVNLAGEPLVGKRWTRFQKELIVQSRVRSTRFLVEALARAKRRPECFVSASAIGYYGARGNEELDERGSTGIGFLADTCRRWEEEALAAERAGIRTVRLRIGIVLGRGGGALEMMAPPFRLGLGGPLGGGEQWMSWIHLEDLVRLVEWAAETRTVRGVLNGTAPHPVRMREFARTFGRVLRRPALLPVPEFVLTFLLGEAADVVVKGQRVVPRKALDAGFRFRFDSLEPALRDLFPR